VIRYTEQDFEPEVKRLTNGAGLQVVYDSVGKTTFEKGLNCLARRGMMVLFGQSSGPVGPFDPQVLNQKGSLFLTRPTIVHYIATRAELVARAGEVLGWIKSGKLKLRIERELPLAQAAEAHRLLEGRKTTGKVLLIPWPQVTESCRYDVAYPSARLERTRDHDRRLRRVGDRRRRLGVRLGPAGRCRLAGRDAPRARAGSQLDRYRGGVRSRPFRRGGRSSAAGAAGRRAATGVHQVRPGLGRARPYEGSAARAPARLHPEGVRSVAPPARRRTDRPLSVSLARRDGDARGGVVARDG